MSPTKQAKSQGNSGKEPKLHQGQNGEKNHETVVMLAQDQGVLLEGT